MPVEARMDVKCKFSRATAIANPRENAHPAAIIVVKLIGWIYGFIYLLYILHCTFPNTITMAARVAGCGEREGRQLDCSHFIWLKVKN